jgi:mRNA interferase MazF
VDFERFDVVRVPFPFTDRQATKNRPALVLSDGALFNEPAGHSVMAMITSAHHPSWPLDCVIGDLSAAGLPVASVIRWKLFTLDHRLIRGALGRLGETDAVAVTAALTRLLGCEQDTSAGATSKSGYV